MSSRTTVEADNAWLRIAGRVAGYFVLHAAAVTIGLAPRLEATVGDIIQIPAGVLCAALLLSRRESWAAYLCAALAAHATTAALAGHTEIRVALFEGAVVALAALIAASLTRWYVGRERSLSSFEAMAWLLIPAVLAAAFCSGVSAAVGLALIGSGDAFLADMSGWARATALGIVIVTPLVCSWAQGLPEGVARPTTSRVLSGAGLLLLFTAACSAIFLRPLIQPGTALQLPIVLLPLLMWAVFVFGVRLVALMCAVQAALAIYGSIHGYGRFAIGVATGFVNYEPLQLYLGVATLSSLMLAVAVGEWRRAAARLRNSHQRFRAYVDNSSEAIWCLELDEPMPVSLPQGDQVEWLLRKARVTEANDAAVSQVRVYSSDEGPMIGRRLSDQRLYEADQIRRNLERFVASDYEVLGLRSRSRRLDGTEGVIESRLIGHVVDGHLLRIWGTDVDITDALNARERIEETEQRFSKAFNSNPLAVTLTDMETLAYIDVNKGFEELHGYSRSEAVGRASTELGIWKDLDERKKVGEILLRDGKVRDFEMEFRTKSGEIRRGLFSAEMFPLGRRRVTVSNVMDITEWRRAEEALRESEERFFKAFNKSPDAIVITRRDNDEYVDVNEAFERFSGFRRDEVVGKRPEELGRWVDEERRQRMRSLVLRSGSVSNVEVSFRHKGGETRIGVVSAEAVEMNRDLFIVSTIRDVTDQRKAESELMKSRELVAKAFGNSPDAIIVSVLSDGLILEVNQGFLELTGRRREEVVGKRATDVGLWTDPVQRDRIVSAMRTHGRLSQEEVEFNNRRGEPVPVSFSGELIEIDNRTCMVSVSRDVSERKRLDEMLLTYQNRLQSLASRLTLAEEAVRRQTAKELHDGLCQELAAMIMRLGVHRGSLDDREQIESVDSILGVLKRAMRSARSIVADLSQQQLFERGLGPAIQSLGERFAEDQGIAVEIHDDERERELAESVQTVLFRAVRELLANVGKHADAGRVVVRLETGTDALAVVVADDGRGFDPAEIEKASQQEGFGLFSIRQQIEWLGGEVELASSPESGSVITLRAPLQRSSADAGKSHTAEVSG